METWAYTRAVEGNSAEEVEVERRDDHAQWTQANCRANVNEFGANGPSDQAAHHHHGSASVPVEVAGHHVIANVPGNGPVADHRVIVNVPCRVPVVDHHVIVNAPDREAMEEHPWNVNAQREILAVPTALDHLASESALSVVLTGPA